MISAGSWVLGATFGELVGPAGFTPGLSKTEDSTNGAVESPSTGMTGVGLGCGFSFWASISTCKVIEVADTDSDSGSRFGN